MRRYRQQVDSLFIYIKRDLAVGLRGIGHKERTMLVGDVSQGAKGMQYARLVVDGHYAYHKGIGRHGFAQLIRTDTPLGVNAKSADPPSVSLEVGTAVKHSTVFRGTGHDMTSRPQIGSCRTQQGHRYSLRGTRCEDDILRIGAHVFGNSLASRFNGGAGHHATNMGTRCVVKDVAVEWHHCLDDHRVYRRSSSVVSVNQHPAKIGRRPSPPPTTVDQKSRP